MSDDTARALGAGDGADPVVIAGKDCFIRPLTAKELAEVTRDCIDQYRRIHLKAYADNLDLMLGHDPTDTERRTIIRDELTKTANWEARDLPRKKGYDPSNIELSDDLREWLSDIYETNGETTDSQLQQIAVNALDRGHLSESQYKLLAGKELRSITIDYVSWWVTGCLDGQIAFIWHCFKQDGVTRDDVAKELGKNENLLVAVSRQIEHLSAPAVGNG